MKQLLLVAGLVGSMTAASAGIHDAQQATSKTTVSTKLVNPTLRGEGAFAPKAVESSQKIDFVNAYQNDYWTLWEGYGGNRTFLYEPETNTLALVHTVRNINQQGLVGGFVYVEKSTDNGSTWTRETLFDLADNYMAFLEAGVAVVNGAPNYFLFGINYQNDGAGNYNNQGFHGYTVDGGEPFPMPGPDLGNDDGYEWTNGSMVSTSAAGAPSSYFVTRLSPPDNTVQYGAYGGFGYDHSTGEFPSNGMPSAWGLNKFIPSTGGPTRSFNIELLASTDEDGTVYAAVNNIFVEDNENRVPGVSISDDRGANWSEFSRMPASIIDTYAANQVTRGEWATPDAAMYDVYGGSDAFVVNGPNDWSYFFRLGHVNTQQQVFDDLHIVEARYRNGAWKLNYVADLNDFNPLFFIVSDTASNSRNRAWTPFVQAYRGHELQAAITKSGSHVVLKWIDANPAFGRFGVNPPATVLNAEGQVAQLDSLFTTDIYFSVRSSNADTWSGSVNITNDLKVDKGTHIPTVIPSAEIVPIIYHQGVRNADLNDTNYLKRMNWPDVWTERELGRPATGYFLRQSVRFGTFNALNPSSVQEQTPYTFSLNDAKPNPATGFSEITWTMDRTANVSLELFNVLGNKVSTLSNGLMTPGIHGVTVNASALPVGAYYYTLTVDGVTMTKQLSIVK